MYELRPTTNGTAELHGVPLRNEVKVVVESMPFIGVHILESKQYNIIYFVGKQEISTERRHLFLFSTKEKISVDVSLLYQTPILGYRTPT